MNILLATDSYKVNHWNMYPEGTTRVYSYFESRKGAAYDRTAFFGLQYLLKKYLAGPVVTQEKIDEAAALSLAHFGSEDYFNRAGWQHILNTHNGYLPLSIKAVPEGTVVPVSNVLMTVENTNPNVPWLTNYVESLLTHVWASTNIATISFHMKEIFAQYLTETAETNDALPFMLHDFGYRGVSSHESAGIGGAGHLVSFMGTDTLPAMIAARDYYDAPLDGLAYSVAATEHSIMTSRGPDGEEHVVADLLKEYPTGILSVVSDSYDIYNFVTNVVGTKYREQILARDGVFVVRPDSNTPQHPNPEDQVVWILGQLWRDFGGVENSKGYKVLDSHVRVLWGDGIGPVGIEYILAAAKKAGFSAENLVFGMGGGLLQKHNRDTQRFAFKSSAQERDGQWHDVWKKPADLSKMSKRGRLALIEQDGKLTTISDPYHKDNLLVEVFRDGEVLNEVTFEQVRANADAAIRSAVIA